MFFEAMLNHMKIALGAGGRRFESCHPDFKLEVYEVIFIDLFFFALYLHSAK